MLLSRVDNHPDISVACGDSLISVAVITLDIEETGELRGLESLLPYILVNTSLLSASCRSAVGR